MSTRALHNLEECFYTVKEIQAGQLHKVEENIDGGVLLKTRQEMRGQSPSDVEAVAISGHP